jgi:quinolinate synthase
VHAGITPLSLSRQRAEHPGAEVLVHPECGCATSVVEAMSAGAIPSDGVQVLSTEGMIRRPAESVNREFIVATETGILHRLRRANPDKTFFAASDRAECQYMKLTTLPKVLNSLERMQYRITVPADVAAKARLALERMVAVGGSTSGPPLVGVAGFDPGE